MKRSIFLSAILIVSSLALGRTVGDIETPPGYTRIGRIAGAFAETLSETEIVEPGEFLAGDGATLHCEEDVIAKTTISPFDNKQDVGVDGIVRLWGDYLWRYGRRGDIAFPLDNGQPARWSDWYDGLRPKRSGGRFTFVQETTPSGSKENFDRYLSFVAEEMGAIALRRETLPIADDSIAIGDLIVSLRDEKVSWVGMVLDLCRNQKGERLLLLGTCGTPSTVLYLPRPFSPVQGVGDWHTLDGARYAIGAGSKAELRRIRLKL
ncbi:MAG: hypothetical protein H6508_02020 [Calditrichaeota bacterium]|nr:hypothetical protein [Calditrichota bacterium]